MAIPKGLTERFRRQLARGEVILFTGAGFSYAASTPSGASVIQVPELKKRLSEIAFPSGEGDGVESSLGDLFQVALSRASGVVGELFRNRLTVSAAKSPARFRDWFSMPWFRHYTLNIDDLDEAIAATYSLPRELHSFSALSHQAHQDSGLQSVHLNGRLREFPRVTFAPHQYAARLGQPDPWYALLVTDLLTHPVLFVGTVLEEPGLWQHVEMRRSRDRADVELRPASYLVAPMLSPARAALLKSFNIDWIQATEEEFYHSVLATSSKESEAGLQMLARSSHPATTAGSLRRIVIDEVSAEDVDLPQFLLGREPTWQDISNGFAVVRAFEGDLARRTLGVRRGLKLITGTAAAGKSTTLMHLALFLKSEGRDVWRYDTRSGSTSSSQVVHAARHAKCEVLMLDDVDLFGEGAGRLLRDLIELDQEMLIIAAIRNSRLHGLAIDEELSDLAWEEVNVPPLEDGDINGLIDALHRAGRLGRMVGMDSASRRAVFREQAGRQLLVAMYYATSGAELEDKVRSECEDLHGASRLIYGMAALLTAERNFATRAELVMGATFLGGAEDGNRLMNEMENLVKRDLLVKNGEQLRVRHRWIAESAMEFYRNNGLVHRLVVGVAGALSTTAPPDYHSRERRMLRRLINHDYLQRLIGDVGQIREVYSSLQDRLSDEFHYWLQRGSLEVEAGDLGLAENYLEAARSLVGRPNYKIENEYAYLTLKKAALDPGLPSSKARAEEALCALEDSIRDRGTVDSYPYHIFGSQGLRWARRAEISSAERQTLLRRLLEAVKEGRRQHPRSADLRQLEADLSREYLLTATDEDA